ncbi:MAG: hypothetical protein K6L73_03395 [Cellvibrionaceae bacterium]
MRVVNAESWFQHQHIEHRQVRRQESLVADHSAEGERLTAETMVDGVAMAQTLEHSDTRMSLSELNTTANHLGGELDIDPPKRQALENTLPPIPHTTAPRTTIPPPPQLVESDSPHQQEIPQPLSLRLQIMKMMVEMITGKKVETIADSEQTNQPQKESNTVLQASIRAEFTESQTTAAENSAFGLRYHYRETMEEYEYSQFSGTAHITLDDGREITIALQRVQERYYQAQDELLIEVGTAAIDPLMISAPNTQLMFTDEKFNFDLNSDGQQEALQQLSQGNYFLALDKNHDGIINNGRELFGPTFGNGFLELAEYDEDGNSFIDSGDSVFTQLRLLDGTGKILVPLDSLNIGAISLDAIATPYTFKNDNNEAVAVSRGSSFYVTEGGNAGSVQQVDYWV